MKEDSFALPMRKSEAVFGWIYLFVHSVLLIFALPYIAYFYDRLTGTAMTEPQLNVVYYAISLTLVLLFMFRYLRWSFYDLCDHIGTALLTILLFYFLYNFLTNLVMLLLDALLAGTTNPNDAAINGDVALAPNAMLAVAVLMAPLVEECLFRGAVFGTLRKKSRFLAYAVSTLLFAVYHLWQYFVMDPDPTLFLYLLQYLPAGILLARCYERSGSIWTSVFLHMIINFVSVYYTTHF